MVERLSLVSILFLRLLLWIGWRPGDFPFLRESASEMEREN
jgi:hypothetical protein